MRVSFIVVAYNAETKLKNLLADLKEQDYDHQKIEVILVDSNSKDRTKQIMTDFAQSAHDFSRICVLDNPKRILPAGWNIALKECQGDIILRVDAHASIPADFIRKNVECIKSGERICGGPRISIIDGENNGWQKTLLLAETSLFGSGIAEYRREKKKKYVSTLAHAAYHKEVFQTVGGYNENLVRTEDNEIHYRMRKAGYKFCFDPEIVSYHHARNNLRQMMKQKFLNGYWIGITLGICPQCFSWYHFVPFFFVLAIAITSIMAGSGIVFPAYLLWGTYGSGGILMALLSISKERFCFWFLLLPVLFFLLHFSYGMGTAVGIIKTIFTSGKSKKREVCSCNMVKN